MNWEQRFKVAVERDYFTMEDIDTAYLSLESVVNDLLRSRGYNKSSTYGELCCIIADNDARLWEVWLEFADLVKQPKYTFMNLVKKFHTQIRNMDLSQALIDKLELTANSKAPLNHNWAPAPSPFFNPNQTPKVKNPNALGNV